MTEALGGRKFIGLLIVSIVGGVIDQFGPRGLGTEFASLLGGAFAVYVGGNVFKAVKAGGSGVDVKPMIDPDLINQFTRSVETTNASIQQLAQSQQAANNKVSALLQKLGITNG